MQGKRGSRGIGGSDGKEEVSDWDCTEGCAVMAMGEQSGELKSGDRNGKRKTHNEFGTFSEKERDSGYFRHGDSGSASRFFKQVKED
jgi:hypothetical protein